MGNLPVAKHKYKSKPKRPLIPKASRPLCTNRYPFNENTPLNILERKFLEEYVKTGDPATAIEKIGVKRTSKAGYRNTGLTVLQQANVQAELKKVMDEIRDNTIMDAREVMQYFTAVARGEIKDQFGLDAPLSERTKAAVEIAKRTADLDIKEKLRQDALDSNVVSIRLIRD